MIRFKTVKGKITAVSFGIFALMILIFAAVEIQTIKRDEYAYLDSITQTVNALLVKHIRGYVFEHDVKNLQLSMDAVESPYIKSAAILDQNGSILVSSLPTTAGPYPDFARLVAAGDRITTDRRYVILNRFDVLDVPIGYLVLEADLQIYYDAVRTKIRTLLLLSLVALAVLLAVSYFIARSVSRPIDLIIRRMRTVRETEMLHFERQPQVEFDYLALSVSELHNALLRLNASLQDEVDKKTRSLQELNDTLQQRIDEEIAIGRKKDQQMLEQSRLAQMGEMISMIAHQWRQPLAAVSATTNALIVKNRNGKYDRDLFHDRLTKIAGYSQHLSTTIDEFRSFFKSGKTAENTTLKVIAQEALGIIRPSIENKNIALITDFADETPLQTYAGELKQVLLNLLKNAEDALVERTVPDPKITIRTYARGNSSAVSVQDNGGGIAPEVLERIFDPYFSTKLEKEGTGLGLYMSKTIVEDHCHGKLRVFRIDDGALFEIVIDTEQPDDGLEIDLPDEVIKRDPR